MLIRKKKLLCFLLFLFVGELLCLPLKSEENSYTGDDEGSYLTSMKDVSVYEEEKKHEKEFVDMTTQPTPVVRTTLKSAVNLQILSLMKQDETTDVVKLKSAPSSNLDGEKKATSSVPKQNLASGVTEMYTTEAVPKETGSVIAESDVDGGQEMMKRGTKNVVSSTSKVPTTVEHSLTEAPSMPLPTTSTKDTKETHTNMINQNSLVKEEADSLSTEATTDIKTGPLTTNQILVSHYEPKEEITATNQSPSLTFPPVKPTVIPTASILKPVKSTADDSEHYRSELEDLLSALKIDVEKRQRVMSIIDKFEVYLERRIKATFKKIMTNPHDNTRDLDSADLYEDNTNQVKTMAPNEPKSAKLYSSITSPIVNVITKGNSHNEVPAFVLTSSSHTKEQEESTSISVETTTEANVEHVLEQTATPKPIDIESTIKSRSSTKQSVQKQWVSQTTEETSSTGAEHKGPTIPPTTPLSKEIDTGRTTDSTENTYRNPTTEETTKEPIWTFPSTVPTSASGDITLPTNTLAETKSELVESAHTFTRPQKEESATLTMKDEHSESNRQQMTITIKESASTDSGAVTPNESTDSKLDKDKQSTLARANDKPLQYVNSFSSNAHQAAYTSKSTSDQLISKHKTVIVDETEKSTKDDATLNGNTSSEINKGESQE